MRATNPKTARPTGDLEEHRAKLRDEALARRNERKQRSDAEQLALLDKRPGLALRERVRLGDPVAVELLKEKREKRQ